MLFNKGFSKHVVNTLVFVISAFAHEYIVSVALGQFQIYILIAFAMQYGLIMWENYFLNKIKLQESNFGNYTLWINGCVLGQPILTIIYYMCYLNAPKQI